MNAKTTIVAVTMFAALAGGVLHISFAKAADPDSAPPDDQVATEALNSVIADCNKSEDDRYKAQEVQFQQAKLQNDAVIKQYQAQNETLHKQYDLLRSNYTSLAMQNDEERKQNEDLQLKYQDMQEQLKDAQQKYDDVMKKLTPPNPPANGGLLGKLKSAF